MSKALVLKRSLGVAVGIVGVALMCAVIVPILAYEVTTRSEFPTYLTPIPESEIKTVATDESVKASTWFEGDTVEFGQDAIRFYTISIPKLGIDNATVAVGGEDLAESLIQYPGTSLPGKYGNAVIFGHSILPMFYNPKNYISIFSTLHQLRKGDRLNVYADGVSYSYKVEDRKEVLPTDLSILDQDVSSSFITLVTCTPPGDPRKPRRLVIRARVVPPDQI